MSGYSLTLNNLLPRNHSNTRFLGKTINCVIVGKFKYLLQVQNYRLKVRLWRSNFMALLWEVHNYLSRDLQLTNNVTFTTEVSSIRLYHKSLSRVES